MITQDELKKYLSYEKDTGIFRWVNCNGNRNDLKGKVAGAIIDRYLKIQILGKRYLAHRLAWIYVYGSLPNGEIDHINGNKFDNRIGNLRASTISQNRSNVGVRKDNSLGFKGISYVKTTGNYQVRLMVNKKRIQVGTFKNLDDAVIAHKEASKNMLGEFVHHSL